MAAVTLSLGVYSGREGYMAVTAKMQIDGCMEH